MLCCCAFAVGRAVKQVNLRPLMMIHVFVHWSTLVAPDWLYCPARHSAPAGDAVLDPGGQM